MRSVHRKETTMLNTIKPRAALVGDAVLTASRQVWLAGLGAAVVTRDWAEKEGGTVFRTLVREGTAVESKAVRFVGDRLESSFTQANTIWKRARRTVTTTVKAYADTAAMLVRESLPASLPKVAVAPARAPHKPAKAKAPTAAKRVKRTRKGVAKRT
jgi:hypothetical protein